MASFHSSPFKTEAPIPPSICQCGQLLVHRNCSWLKNPTSVRMILPPGGSLHLAMHRWSVQRTNTLSPLQTTPKGDLSSRVPCGTGQCIVVQRNPPPINPAALTPAQVLLWVALSKKLPLRNLYFRVSDGKPDLRHMYFFFFFLNPNHNLWHSDVLLYSLSKLGDEGRKRLSNLVLIAELKSAETEAWTLFFLIPLKKRVPLKITLPRLESGKRAEPERMNKTRASLSFEDDFAQLPGVHWVDLSSGSESSHFLLTLHKPLFS